MPCEFAAFVIPSPSTPGVAPVTFFSCTNPTRNHPAPLRKAWSPDGHAEQPCQGQTRHSCCAQPENHICKNRPSVAEATKSERSELGSKGTPPPRPRSCLPLCARGLLVGVQSPHLVRVRAVFRPLLPLIITLHLRAQRLCPIFCFHISSPGEEPTTQLLVGRAPP